MPPLVGIAVELGRKRRLDLGGITASILASASASRNQFASNARSARSFPQDSPSMSAAVPRRSWACPRSSRKSIRLPSASIARQWFAKQTMRGGQRHDLGGHTTARVPPLGRLLRNRLPGNGLPGFGSPFCALTLTVVPSTVRQCIENAREGTMVYSKSASSADSLNMR